jgi:eukaryotic-like serine/threonine-protein kinase
MKCPYCGTVNQSGESFCSNCGGYLDGSDAHTVVGNNSQTMVSTGSNTGPTTTTGGGTGGARTLAPNVQLQAGRYVVEKVLGQGGMGAAVLARDTRVSNKRVVIKELVSENTDPKQHQEDVHNFEREVETLATLDHPLIPTVTDSFQEGSHYFMVQEYAAGENLEDRMERVNQPMAEHEALTYASQVLDILDYLEQQSPPIVHRDIKPANIIIGAKDKRARLVDFGIARTAVATPGAKRKQTTALGTPGYAPPEQYQGNADARSDLYALAATLHHILTNRDPRNYPPFVYPPVRTLNSKLTPDIERVLDRALKINANERYQNAAAMKHDIDEILELRFSSSGDMSNYTLRTSTQTNLSPVAPTPSGANSQAGVGGHTPYPITPPPPPPPSGGQQQQQMVPPIISPGLQSGTYAPPKQRRTISPVARNFILLIVVILLISLVLFVPNILSSHGGGAQPINPNGSTGSTSSNTGASSSSVDTNPISVTQAGNALIGISDGTYTFDTGRTDANLKEQAAADFKSGNKTGAKALWNQAVSQDTNDAESLIYLEDQRVLDSGSPYITLVVATMPSGDNAIVGVGRFDLQGAYVLQKEFNDGSKLPNGLKVRLLIASSGDSTQNVTKVANQIVLLSKSDRTFIGVMGWPYSALAETAVPIFSNAHIPMVSETASADDLSNVSQYFFHVNPTNKAEAIAGAQYAEKTLGAKNVAVFADYADPYSQNLGSDFTQQFTGDGGTIIKESYTRGQASSIQTAVQQALQQKPDLIYFAGYSNDVSSLLSALNAANAPTSLKVLGGDALYELSGYQGVSLSRLRFTAFAYPDEWDVQGLSSQKPAFFSEYASDFDPNHQHTTGSPYGFTRPDSDAMLSYDATTAMLDAVATAAKASTNVTVSSVESALQHTAFQGVSGWITFGQNGDPVNKALAVLTVDSQGHIQMQKVVNKFLNS